MRVDRRRLLRSLPPFLAASCLSPSFALAARKVSPAALLVPLTGPRAALGRSMARAAALAQGPDARGLIVLDTGPGAAAAARTALRQGAGIVLGPLISEDVRPVLGVVAGRVPVLAFSNDLALRDSGAFLLGITADQAVGPLLHYARSRGVRRVLLARSGDAWGAQVGAAAVAAAAREGVTLTSAEPAALDRILRGTDAPDALLLSGDPAPARAARDAGVQVLAAFTGLDYAGDALATLEGAWLSAPDPAGFATFAGAYEQANGAPPGVLAGLAYDAARIALTLRQSEADRAALLAPTGFAGVCGPVRFRDDGSAQRGMAIVSVERGAYRLIEPGGIGG